VGGGDGESDEGARKERIEVALEGWGDEGTREATLCACACGMNVDKKKVC